MLNVFSAMRRIIVLLLLTIACQAADVKLWLRLRPGRQYVHQASSQRTPKEWQNLLAIQRSRPVHFRQSERQPPGAGRTTNDFENRIVDGQTAAHGQFPWHAHIVLGSSGLCGGSLISSIWVLTAASCVSGFASYTVTLGVTSLLEPEEGGITLTSRYWVMHSVQEGVFLQNDIAIIKLPGPVAFTDFISPVRLPRRSQLSETYAGQDAIVSGYGIISNFEYTTSSILQFLQTSIISNEECFQYFPLDLEDVNICSTGSGSPCDGDTGGPLVVAEDDGQYTQVGIMSFNMLLCPLGVPTAYARVTSYLEWIETYAGIALRE